MAYENQTFEVILKRMMYRVNLVYPTLDDREGSLIYNALAPAATAEETLVPVIVPSPKG